MSDEFVTFVTNQFVNLPLTSPIFICSPCGHPISQQQRMKLPPNDNQKCSHSNCGQKIKDFLPCPILTNIAHKLQQMQNLGDCAICLDQVSVESHITLSCGHRYCAVCIKSWVSTSGKLRSFFKCPKCNKEVDKAKFYKENNIAVAPPSKPSNHWDDDDDLSAFIEPNDPLSGVSMDILLALTGIPRFQPPQIHNQGRTNRPYQSNFNIATNSNNSNWRIASSSEDEISINIFENNVPPPRSFNQTQANITNNNNNNVNTNNRSQSSSTSAPRRTVVPKKKVKATKDLPKKKEIPKVAKSELTKKEVKEPPKGRPVNNKKKQEKRRVPLKNKPVNKKKQKTFTFTKAISDSESESSSSSSESETSESESDSSSESELSTSDSESEISSTDYSDSE